MLALLVYPTECDSLIPAGPGYLTGAHLAPISPGSLVICKLESGGLKPFEIKSTASLGQRRKPTQKAFHTKLMGV